MSLAVEQEVYWLFLLARLLYKKIKLQKQMDKDFNNSFSWKEHR